MSSIIFMKMIPAILILIVILAIIGIALFYSKTKSNNLSELAVWVQSIATVVLVLITGFYAWQTKQSVDEMQRARESQEQGFNQYVAELQKSRLSQEAGVAKYIQELQESRKQETKPNVYGLFFWSSNLGKFFMIIKNIGVGPAFDVKTTYSTIDDGGKGINDINECGMLGLDKEKVYSTPFSTEHMKMKNHVKIEITYKDSFGQTYSNTYEHHLGKLANDPIPVEFADVRRKLEHNFDSSDIRQWLQMFHKTLEELQKDVRGIKDKLQSMD